MYNLYDMFKKYPDEEIEKIFGKGFSKKGPPPKEITEDKEEQGEVIESGECEGCD